MPQHRPRQNKAFNIGTETLDERESQLEPVIDDVRRSVLMKATEIGELRAELEGAGHGPAAHTELKDWLRA